VVAPPCCSAKSIACRCVIDASVPVKLIRSPCSAGELSSDEAVLAGVVSTAICSIVRFNTVCRQSVLIICAIRFNKRLSKNRWGVHGPLALYCRAAQTKHNCSSSVFRMVDNEVALGKGPFSAAFSEACVVSAAPALNGRGELLRAFANRLASG